MIGSAKLEPGGDDRGAEHDAERHESVHARVVAVGDQRRARQPAPGPKADLSSDLVSEEADGASRRQSPAVPNWLRINQAHDRLVERDAGADKIASTTPRPGPALRSAASEEERHSQWN